jgi:hypothetical protein
VVARQVLSGVEQGLSAGTLSREAADAAAPLRDSLRQLVHTVQFQQIQNGLASQPTAGQSYLSFGVPLSAALGFGDTNLRVSFKEGEGGRAQVDPDDAHLVFQLDLAHLKRLEISVHVHRRSITCQMVAQNPEIQRVVSDAAPKLREGLEGLGYTVAPIDVRASFKRRSEPSSFEAVEDEADVAARVNVRA